MDFLVHMNIDISIYLDLNFIFTLLFLIRKTNGNFKMNFSNLFKTREFFDLNKIQNSK